MSKENAEYTRQVAKRLNETDRKPIAQIRAIVESCGTEFTDVMVDSALAIHADEGMETVDNSRKRTLGGIFFYLVRGALPVNLRREIFPYKNQRQKALKSPYPELDWDDRVEQLASLLEGKKGRVDEVNIVLKGRPNHIEHRADMVILALEQPADPDHTYPYGVPDVPPEPTTFYVFVGEQQWKKQGGDKLEDDKGATILVEGACAYDGEMGGIAVFTRSIKVHTSKSKKAKADKADKKEAKAEAAAPVKEKAAAKPTPKKEKAPKPAAKASAAPAQTQDADMPDMSSYSEEVAKKLRPLYGARRMFQKRLADIEALPADKQSGLQAAKMMLERTEKQIEELEKQTSS